MKLTFSAGGFGDENVAGGKVFWDTDVACCCIDAKGAVFCFGNVEDDFRVVENLMHIFEKRIDFGCGM